jgi:uncharacterized protein YlxP (DUF503 family)
VTVSLMQCIIHLPESGSLKDKRQVVRKVKDKLWRKYRLSVAEVDLHDSLQFAQIGAALVCNSKTQGEKVLQKALSYIEEEARVEDVGIYTEYYD